MKIYKDRKLISFVGYSGSGKTTFILQVIKELKSRGYSLALIKHDAHEFEMDKEGKDSYRFFHEGADIVNIFSKTKTGMVAKNEALLKGCNGEAPSVTRIIKSLPQDIDIIIVEGCRQSDVIKIGLSRKATGKGLSMNPKELVAVITDENTDKYKNENPELVFFGLEDVKGVADYIASGIFRFRKAELMDFSYVSKYSYVKNGRPEEIINIINTIKPEEFTECINIQDAGGRIAARDYEADSNYPPFDMSSCSGFAISSEDADMVPKGRTLRLNLTENVACGDMPAFIITKDCAAAVHSGCAIPFGADTVINASEAEIMTDTVIIKNYSGKQTNIIEEGSIYKAGCKIAKKGEVINPGTLKAFAAFGINDIEVQRKVKTAVISIGSELSDVCEAVPEYHIRNTTAYLTGQLSENYGAEAVYYGTIPDDTKQVEDRLRLAMLDCDLIITTGGASQNNYDIVFKVLKTIGAKILVWGADFYPAGSFVLAVKGKKVFCGISGDSHAAQLSMSIFGKCLIKHMNGQHVSMRKLKMRLGTDFYPEMDCTEYLTGCVDVEDGLALFIPEQNQVNNGCRCVTDRSAVGIIPKYNGIIPQGSLIGVYII